MPPVIDPTAIVDPGCQIGDDTRVWHFSHLVGGCRVGARCSIGQNVVIMPTAVVGDGCRIQNNVSVYDGVTLEADVFIGPSAVFTNVVTPRAFIPRKSEYRPTTIRRGASIGANATIVCGHEVGEYALVGAGAVVTADIPAFALATGVPARVAGWVSRAAARLSFGSDGLATCPLTGERYRLTTSDDGREAVELIGPQD